MRAEVGMWWLILAACAPEPAADGFAAIPLASELAGVQPMTGMVLWVDDWRDHPAKDVVQLEYAYVEPSSIVVGEGVYDWTAYDALLDDVASRGHQAITRFYYVYPGRQTAVPAYLKALPDYTETSGVTEGQTTWFPDWSHPALQSAHLDFYAAFAARYDADPRLAFLQVGFGLWGEYHIYEGPAVLGQTFPSKAFQRTFLAALDGSLDQLSYSVSIDSGDGELSGIHGDPATEALGFGLFDDSFMHEHHDQYNASMFRQLGVEDRHRESPVGGELSYYSAYDQQHALDVDGMYGRTFEALAAEFHVSYMIGNDQPSHQSVERIEAAGMALGYALEVVRFEASASESRVDVLNRGIAPLYVDAWVTVDGVRARESLRGLAPGETRRFTVAAGGQHPTLTITADRLVDGQQIGFDASLAGGG